MGVPGEITNLIERFDRNRDVYMSGQYKEAQIRSEFIDPFFETLGWDITNRAGYAEPYKDVIHEDAIKVGGVTKAPDYCFRIGGARKFFVEAKKPSVNIKDEISPAFQLRRYAWSAKLPLSILTDFHEFAVYDCRIKPLQTDKSSAARTIYLEYAEYPKHWDEIHSVFSKDAVLKGSFDKYVESSKLKKGTAEVDAEFLKEIETWRDNFARNIAIRNSGLSQRELNFAVQRIIDRIIFLRICEDRGIEHLDRLRALLNGAGVYKRLIELFREADDKYNSGLFHFRPEKDRSEEPDRVTLDLNIDDKVLKEIIGSLYYPESPYEFSVLPADILGQVYEQFLGKVIRLTPSHQAKIEYKPEVKKAGGVYYTPTYIVDYIVKNTVGKILGDDAGDGKNGDGNEGNGNEGNGNEGNGRPDIPVGRVGTWDTTRDKNVPPTMGVGTRGKNAPPTMIGKINVNGRPDIPVGRAGTRDRSRDRNVPPTMVAKIKILDPACGSGSFLIGAYQYLLDWHRDWYFEDGPAKHTKEIYQGAGGAWRLTTAEKKRILLNNIFGVDIDPQAVEVTKLSLLLKVLEGETEESIRKQLKLFHERALPDLGKNIKCGNSLIGPDFYKSRQMNLLDDDEKYRINVFDWDAEFPDIMKKGGFDVVIGNPPYGYMIPDSQKEYFSGKYKNQDYQQDLYLLFLERYEKVLKSKGLLGVIVSNTWLQSVTLRKIRKYMTTNYYWNRILHLPEKVFQAVVDTHVLIFEKATSKEPRIQSVEIDIRKDNIITLMNELPWETINKNGDPINIVAPYKSHKLFNKIQGKSLPLTNFCFVYNGVKPFEKGKGNPPQTDEIMKSKPFVKEGKKPDKSWSPLLRGSLIQRYINLWNKDYWIKYGPWLAAPRDPKIFEAPEKIMVRQTGDSIIAILIEKSFIARNNLHVILPKDNNFNLRYILGIMNSKLMDFFYTIMNPEKREALAEVKMHHVENLPICSINFSDHSDKSRHDRMVELVEGMLDMNKRLVVAKAEQERVALARQIGATDAQIDELVYELYGLTEDEIRIVEGEGK